MQLLVDNRSDSTKMHGATIRFLVTIFWFDQDSIVVASSKVRLHRDGARERESKRVKYNVLRLQLTRSSEYELYKQKFN